MKTAIAVVLVVLVVVLLVLVAVLQGSYRSWRVLEFKSYISRPGKSWNQAWVWKVMSIRIAVVTIVSTISLNLINRR